MTAADLLRDAARGLRLYRLRSWLTAASFAAGTAAAISLFAVTDGARAEILRRLQALGVDLLAVRAVGETRPGDPPALDLADVAALEAGAPFVVRSAPVRLASSSVLLSDRKVTVRVVGTTPGYFALLQLPFESGRPFPERGARTSNTCVLGAGAARVLFPAGGAVGALVKVGENWYRVVGVLAADSGEVGTAAGGVEGAGREVYLPIGETLATHGSDRQEVREIWLRVDHGVSTESAAGVVERLLLRRHEGRRHFEVATPEHLLRQERTTRGLLDVLLGVVAVAAYGLGAIGMMSMSWQAVTQRMREIAIRRAVGARRDEVLLQFVLEGVLLAAAGALAGVFAGALFSATAAVAAGWPWTLSASRLAAAIAGAIAVALLSTLYPARRAAMLDPVTALRFER